MPVFWNRLGYWTRWWLKLGLALVTLWFGYDFYGRLRWKEFWERYDVPGTPLNFERVREELRTDSAEQLPRFLDTPSMQKWEARNPGFDQVFTDFLTKTPPGIVKAGPTAGMIQGWGAGKLVPLTDYLPGGSTGGVNSSQAILILKEKLAPADQAFSELSRDSEVPGQSWLQEVPNIPSINDFSRLLSLRIRVAIAARDGDRALNELVAGLRFAERMREGQSLVGMLVQIAVLETLENATWDGIRSNIWDHEQLERLSQVLGELTITRDFSKVALHEIGWSWHSIQEMEVMSGGYRGYCFDQLKHQLTPSKIFRLSGGDWAQAAWHAGEVFLPDGHLHNGFAQFGKFWESYGLHPPDSDGRFPEFSVEDLDQTPYRPHPVFGWPVPNMGKVGTHTLSRQQFVDLARIACEVEQFRNREGHYPKGLADLPSDVHLPQDRFQPSLPIRYRLTADGSNFFLIASGSDRVDDGGNRTLDYVFASFEDTSPLPGKPGLDSPPPSLSTTESSPAK